MAMQAGNLREGEPVSEINTTPLIDVMLVLLVMLLITLPPQRHAVKLDTPVPCPSCVAEKEPPPPIRIIVDFDGGILWDGELVSASELDRRFASEVNLPDQREVHIEPHRLAKYGVVAHVMAAAQREGIKRMGMVGGSQQAEF